MEEEKSDTQLDVKDVKSKAVVKYSSVHTGSFNRLECNTDLNLPPSNWLTSTNYGLHQALFQSPVFPSFNMAHMFPDCLGEVDVVSDAENLKRLLKLPYTSKGTISMIVHKVGNTLLLDEFDIQKYLLRKADDDWNWLRNFILTQLLVAGGNNMKDKSREAIQRKNLLSKFLYYSLTQQSSSSQRPNNETQTPMPLPLTGPLLPEPKVETNMPDPKSSHVFNRNVVWTFEDLRMLIGTDMPIFGGPNRPCISLRLRDMAKPINILTGIDYWLDNLMCNVPEVVMCYHLDGIVQKYEIIKTEDLPYLEDSQFSPHVVLNVAQNILAFLKVNATKAGHTYWLFKGRNDDVVKLYDLTTLCKDETDEENKENLFTVPVAMLLYTVARNMKNTATRISPKTAGSIRALLDSCIKLLPKEQFPQIVTSSHYILSDLHIPSGIDPKSPKFDTDTKSVYQDEDEIENDLDELDETIDDNNLSIESSEHSLDDSVAVLNISDTLKDFHLMNNTYKTPKPPEPLIASIEERCRISLEHISSGISCLEFFNANEEQCVKESEARAKDEEKQRILHEEQNPNMAKPFKPIALPYEKINRNNHRKNEERKESITTSDSVELTKLNKSEKERKYKKNIKSKDKNNKAKDINDFLTTVETEAPASLPQHQRIGTNFNTQQFGSWNVHLKLLLLEKASLTYATLAEHNYGLEKYGLSLKAIYMSYRCQQSVIRSIKTIQSQKSCLLGRAGDCFFQMSKNWRQIDTYLAEYNQKDEVEMVVNCELEKDGIDHSLYVVNPTENVAQLMTASYRLYELALEDLEEMGIGEEDPTWLELTRRLGNVRNELGLKYMYWAQEEYEKSFINPEKQEIKDEAAIREGKAKSVPIIINLAHSAYECLTAGIVAFMEANDPVNLSFLYCNMGRFMRFRAYIKMDADEEKFTDNKKMFYAEAFTSYQKGRDALISRQDNPELWDMVSWEWSTALFTYVKDLQDHSTRDDTTRTSLLEREVLELLHKSLSICEEESTGPRQICYAYRSGLVHKRIASFHYNHLRKEQTKTDTLPRTIMQLCTIHYEKAATILESLREGSDLMVVQLERISLNEFLSQNTSHAKLKIKYLQTALEICLNLKNVFKIVVEKEIHYDPSVTNIENRPLFEDHVYLLETRLQNILKTLIKMLISTKDSKKIVDIYKRMYLEALTGKLVTGTQQQTLAHFAQHYFDLLTRVKQLECTLTNQN